MRFSIVVFVSLVATVSASALYGRQTTAAAPPDCALPCYTDPTLPYGTCAATDNACLCKNQAFITAATTCITQKCTSPTDLAAAITFSQGLCSAAGVTLTGIPTVTGTTMAPTTTKAPASTTSAAVKPSGAASSNNVPAIFGIALAGAIFAL